MGEGGEGGEDELLWVEVIAWQLWLHSQKVVRSTGSKDAAASCSS